MSKGPTLTELRERIDREALPKHVGIIMDGNGRWARRRHMPRIYGHKRGAERVRSTVELCRKLDIPVLTLYAFSDENWGRPREEVAFLMDMLGAYLKSEIRQMKTNGIRFRTIGRTGRLPRSAQQWIAKAADETADNRGMVLNLALSYGGRSEILQAVQRMAAGGPLPAELGEQDLAAHLDTAGLPDPDLIIRTSGEKRISNFLLWQAAYAELYFTDVLWPDFDERQLLLALLDFQGRQRRFGLTGEQVAEGDTRRTSSRSAREGRFA
jgi:undecaprenyl diphosphate synthase